MEAVLTLSIFLENFMTNEQWKPIYDLNKWLQGPSGTAKSR